MKDTLPQNVEIRAALKSRGHTSFRSFSPLDFVACLYNSPAFTVVVESTLASIGFQKELSDLELQALLDHPEEDCALIVHVSQFTGTVPPRNAARRFTRLVMPYVEKLALAHFERLMFALEDTTTALEPTIEEQSLPA